MRRERMTKSVDSRQLDREEQRTMRPRRCTRFHIIATAMKKPRGMPRG